MSNAHQDNPVLAWSTLRNSSFALLWMATLMSSTVT
jgi:hypothetical protein